ncbi:hypothetical protein C8R43DRAFT_1108763 [Mycena crocata]|nr:hypothetical protein C8R43DRAFT_1108763 [Mycena crocata]
MAHPSTALMLAHRGVEVWLTNYKSHSISHGPVTVNGNQVTTTVQIPAKTQYRVRWRTVPDSPLTAQCRIMVPSPGPHEQMAAACHFMDSTAADTQYVISRNLTSAHGFVALEIRRARGPERVMPQFVPTVPDQQLIDKEGSPPFIVFRFEFSPHTKRHRTSEADAHPSKRKKAESSEDRPREGAKKAKINKPGSGHEMSPLEKLLAAQAEGDKLDDEIEAKLAEIEEKNAAKRKVLGKSTMLMHNGLYAWLQGRNNRKLAHSKGIVDVEDNTISATITVKKAAEFFFCFSTHASGQRTLPPISCVGEVFLSTRNGAVRLGGSALMNPEVQSCQVKNKSIGNGPAHWFETPEGDPAFVYLRIRKARAIKSDSDDKRDVLEFIAADKPLVTFRFDFASRRRDTGPATRPVVLIKTLKAVKEDCGHEKSETRKRGRSHMEPDAGENLSCSSDLASLADSRRSEEIDSGTKNKRRRSSPDTQGSEISGPSTGASRFKELKAEYRESERLDKEMTEKLLALKKTNAEKRRMLDSIQDVE